MTTSGMGTNTVQWHTNNTIHEFTARNKVKHLFPKTQQGEINTRNKSKLAKTFKYIVSMLPPREQYTYQTTNSHHEHSLA